MNVRQTSKSDHPLLAVNQPYSLERIEFVLTRYKASWPLVGSEASGERLPVLRPNEDVRPAGETDLLSKFEQFKKGVTDEVNGLVVPSVFTCTHSRNGRAWR